MWYLYSSRALLRLQVSRPGGWGVADAPPHLLPRSWMLSSFIHSKLSWP